VPSWTQLLRDFEAQPDDTLRAAWLQATMTQALREIRRLQGDRNVVLWGSAFLQKPMVPSPFISMTGEDLNGWMSVIHGMDCTRGLSLILHTPGGETNAAESIVAYLRSKFTSIEVIVPTFAMSAGTMVSLASDRLIMGRHSQLGPIDPQLPLPALGRFVSAGAIVDQYKQAHAEILKDPNAARVWASILASLGPALLVEAQYALDYGERMVARWLESFMFKRRRNKAALAKKVAAHFGNASTHKSHGRRIDRKEARAQGIRVRDLEPTPALQEQVLTAYHLMTIAFEKSPSAKLLWSDAGTLWIKNVQVAVAAPPTAAPAAPPGP